METESIRLLRELSEAFGPSGFEDEVAAIARREGAKWGDVREDTLRNMYLYRRENTGNRPVVVLDAHSDEVGLMVQYVHPNGLLQIVPLGGWAPGVLPGQTVRVRRRDGGFVRGVIASVPPHFATSAKPGDAADCRIDVGASSIQDVEALGIGVGAPVVPDTAFSYDEARGLCFGKAFDCRVGCAAVLETLRRLQGETLAVDVVGVLSSQEEVGERGGHGGRVRGPSPGRAGVRRGAGRRYVYARLCPADCAGQRAHAAPYGPLHDYPSPDDPPRD